MNQVTGVSKDLTMSSKEIAELTGKRHNNVLADIRKMLDDLGFHSADFSAQYKDSTGRNLPCYQLPKRETLLLAGRYNSKIGSIIMDKWEKLEKAQVPVTHVPRALPQTSNVTTMSSLEIAELTGKEHYNVIVDVRNMLSELGFHSLDFSSQYKDSTGRTLPCYQLPKRETLILVSGYNLKMRAAIIDRWQELEARLETPTRGARPSGNEKLDMTIALIRAMGEDLKVAESGKLLMYHNAAKAFDIPTSVVPNYAIDAPSTGKVNPASSEVTLSATALLKEYGIKCSTQAFNKKMIEAGLMVEKERASTKEAIKKFKVLTDLSFGKNVVSPQNPRETAPHYYASVFGQLLKKLGLDKEI